MKMTWKSCLLIACILLAALLSACRLSSPAASSPPATAAASLPATTSPSATAPAVIVKPGDYEETLVAGGRARNYLLHVPPAYDGLKKMALVIVLHGGGGNDRFTAAMTGMSPKADKAGFIVVYPNGTGPVGDVRLLTWNAGNCCGYALDNKVDDTGFIREMINQLEMKLAIDTARIYATGISNGGMMSYRLGLEMADKLAAIAPVAGAIGVANPAAANPVSVVIFHGTADEHVLYNGGAPVQQLDTHPRVEKSVAYAVDFWVKTDGCNPTSVNETKGHIIKSDYSGGRNGTEVVLYTVVGGKHAWPGGKPAWIGGDAPTQEISATDLMWDFFAAHPKK